MWDVLVVAGFWVFMVGLLVGAWLELTRPPR
jgi:hypothetical protein